MIIKKEKKGNVILYTVKKDYDDDKLINKIIDKKLTRSDVNDIIDEDCDVYTEEGKLLLRFRKNKISDKNINDFYDNVISFAQSKTNNRGSASSSQNKSIYSNPQIMSNIIGYFDKLSPKQKFSIKKAGKQLPTLTVRETRFLTDYPDRYKKLIPLIKDVDKLYAQMVPDKYKLQKKKANQTYFKIDNTAFTTITTNVNFQTAVHTDKGDDQDGFGNLTVIEHGKYLGGETCFPQYGIGVNMRSNDIIFMDVHQPHGNLPIVLETPDAKRLSVVCYLRKNIWEKTKGKSKKFMINHINKFNMLFKSNKTRKIKS